MNSKSPKPVLLGKKVRLKGVQQVRIYRYEKHLLLSDGSRIVTFTVLTRCSFVTQIG
jgi:hypothetical protein